MVVVYLNLIHFFHFFHFYVKILLKRRNLWWNYCGLRHELYKQDINNVKINFFFSLLSLLHFWVSGWGCCFLLHGEQAGGRRGRQAGRQAGTLDGIDFISDLARSKDMIWDRECLNFIWLGYLREERMGRRRSKNLSPSMLNIIIYPYQ